MKKCRKKDFNVFQSLLGKEIIDIIWQIDFFIINFGQDIQFSFHINSLVKFYEDNYTYFCSNDIYYSRNKYFNYDQTIQEEYLQKSNLYKKMNTYKHLFLNQKVAEVITYLNGDVMFKLENGMKIAVFIDDSSSTYECYRLIYYEEGLKKFIMSFDFNVRVPSEHFVYKKKKNFIYLKID